MIARNVTRDWTTLEGYPVVTKGRGRSQWNEVIREEGTLPYVPLRLDLLLNLLLS